MLVTHDRYLLDRVSTAVLGLDGEGGTGMFADYWQWEQAGLAAEPGKSDKKGALVPKSAAPAGKKKLSYMEAREWEQMEARILEVEQGMETIRAEMHSPEVVSDGPRLEACYKKLQASEDVVHTLYARWAELEAKQG